MKYKTFKYKNYTNCYFEVGNYAYNPQAMFIQIKNDNEGDILTATVNMPNYLYMPDTTTIKNYSENSGITKFLKKLGIIEDIYTSQKRNSFASEHETIDFCQINIDKLKKYSKEFHYDWSLD